MKKLNKIRTIIRIIFSWFLYGCSFVVPRATHLWVFYGWHTSTAGEIFADNSKYFFLYASRHGRANGIQAVWLSYDSRLVRELRAAGYHAYTRDSLGGIYHAFRAGYTIIGANMDLESWRYMGWSKVIQLWHGVPIKKIGYQPASSFKDTSSLKIFSPQLYVRPYLNVSTSVWYTEVVAGAFRYDPRTFRIVGLPRNDSILEDMSGSEIDRLELPQPPVPHRGRTMLYAPTFRPGGSNPLDQIDLPSLFDFLEQEDAVFYVSLHPKFSTYKAGWENRFSSRIFFIGAGRDIYPQLRHFDVCITDYSSISLDFLFVDRPIVYYQYDFDEYAKNPGFQDNASKLMPGYRARNFQELLGALKEVCAGKNSFAAERARTRTLAFQDPDGKSSQRLYEVLRQDIG